MNYNRNIDNDCRYDGEGEYEHQNEILIAYSLVVVDQAPLKIKATDGAENCHYEHVERVFQIYLLVGNHLNSGGQCGEHRQVHTRSRGDL